MAYLRGCTTRAHLGLSKMTLLLEEIAFYVCGGIQMLATFWALKRRVHAAIEDTFATRKCLAESIQKLPQ